MAKDLVSVLPMPSPSLFPSDSIQEYCDTIKFGTDKNQLNGSAHEYVFVNDVIILLDGDLIVTTKLVFDLHSDFVSTDPLSGSCAAWSML